MLSDSLVESFRARLDALGLELADLRIGGTQHRPLVQVRIEWPPSEPPRRVTVDDCATASRALEAWLDADSPLGRRYMLEVSSPGLERPVRWHRHWVRFVGREVQATVAGLGRVRARAPPPSPGPRGPRTAPNADASARVVRAPGSTPRACSGAPADCPRRATPRAPGSPWHNRPPSHVAAARWAAIRCALERSEER